MNKNIIAYSLPVLTLIGLIVFSFLNPNITGFAVSSPPEIKDSVNATISIFTSDGIVLPPDAQVIIYLDDKSSSMSVRDFILKSGGEYRIADGVYEDISYSGEGYTGNYNYLLDLSYFGLSEVSSQQKHSLRIVIMYQGKIISESSQEFNTNQ